jgi:hypothetical protein
MNNKAIKIKKLKKKKKIPNTKTNKKKVVEYLPSSMRP